MADLVSDFEALGDAGNRLVQVARSAETAVAVDCGPCGSQEAADAVTQFAFMLRTDLQVVAGELLADGQGVHEVVEALDDADRSLAGGL